MLVKSLIKPIVLLLFFSLNSFSSNLNVKECASSDRKYDQPDYAETEEERIIRIDQQLAALLNSFEECVEATNLSLSEMSNHSNNSSSASASNSASGNEVIPNKKEQAENISSVEVDAKKTNLPDDIVTGDNGSTPKDIPDISSDDTTARQLRAVAEEEEDPVLKEIYWDAYREYKGIKSKN